MYVYYLRRICKIISLLVFGGKITGECSAHTEFPRDMFVASECPHRSLDRLRHTQQHHEVRRVVDEYGHKVQSPDVVRPLLNYHVVCKELEENADHNELAYVGKVDKSLEVCSSEGGNVRC